MQTVVLRSCSGENGISWITENGNPALSFHGEAFCEAVYEEQDWIRDYTFRFRGISRAREKQKIMVFYLDEPLVVNNDAARKAFESLEIDQDGLLSRYIPIKNSELNEKDGRGIHQSASMIYPFRKKRDSIINSLTEEDAGEEGEVVVNPVIGEIPSRENVVEELQALLMSM